jgi:hypothetical protein
MLVGRGLENQDVVSASELPLLRADQSWAPAGGAALPTGAPISQSRVACCSRPGIRADSTRLSGPVIEVVRLLAFVGLIGLVGTFHGYATPTLVRRFPGSGLRRLVPYLQTMRWLGPILAIVGIGGAVAVALFVGL